MQNAKAAEKVMSIVVEASITLCQNVYLNVNKLILHINNLSTN